ncbi:MAG TPA: hypothetical protein VMT64_13320, partial [Candidatus Binataceae bacterium]|nr:hypothetical protein [Candidatus Binataceae bacterium]
MLMASDAVKSVALRRSAATGEVDFGRSDIDLMVIVHPEKAADGGCIEALYRSVTRARRFNPALTDVEVYTPDAVAAHAGTDTFWASSDRRAAMLLCGDPIEIPSLPVDPNHALHRFLFFLETFFSIALQRRNERNLRKISLECWNAYASAERLIDEPYLLRSEMEAHALRVENKLNVTALAEPRYASRFVLELADRMHRSRMPVLQKLDRPLIFEAITAP